MTGVSGLNWFETADGWRVEVDEHSSMHCGSASRGATYEIRNHESPPVFELRWLWHPDFREDSPEKREELERNYTEFHWHNPFLVRKFESLAEAMRDAQNMEEQRLQQCSVDPHGALDGISVQFASDYDGNRYAIVDDREADLAGWKIETVNASLGTRDIKKFSRNIQWAFVGGSFGFPWVSSDLRNPWSAACGWGQFIIRWIPSDE